MLSVSSWLDLGKNIWRAPSPRDRKWRILGVQFIGIWILERLGVLTSCKRLDGASSLMSDASLMISSDGQGFGYCNVCGGEHILSNFSDLSNRNKVAISKGVLETVAVLKHSSWIQLACIPSRIGAATSFLVKLIHGGGIVGGSKHVEELSSIPVRATALFQELKSVSTTTT